MTNRKTVEQREEKFLAPYAMKSKSSLGRRYPEKEHPYRSCYQRDRDRIIHSTAFRRLEYKTQVFVNHEGDYYRTRLTHTLEVAQISRTIARALGLNEDLVETISLVHDIGHPPFGHSGEATLKELMKEHGGFDHNLQGLRVVDLLEERYPDFPGLNLTWEVREGISKHTTLFDQPNRAMEIDPGKSPLLEIQVVDVADEIAYDNHDLDDGLTSGLVKEEDLLKVPLWKETAKRVDKLYPGLKTKIRKYQLIRWLIDMQVSDLILQTQKKIKKLKIKSREGVQNEPRRIVGFSEEMIQKRKPLREFLFKNLYQHYRVARMSDKASRFIKELFNLYLTKPEELPPATQKRLKEEGRERVICDYIAGMTDRYALDEYKKLFEPYERV